MKTLHLIRHAKSSWDHPYLEDFQRPLNTRGYNDCKIMAPEILRAGCEFEHVFCSIANRAQLTIQTISNHLPDLNFKWNLEENLYTFDAQDILEWCTNLSSKLDQVVIVGHNPALTDFVNGFGDRDIENVATCAYVQLQFKIKKWKDLSKAKGNTQVFIKPKMFK